ncbi:MAG: lipopolysaccharide transport periplasmic protein LptA [Proteobacteria bacterium]|nr:lipopolysaccharide transport periplasmic protein LptA [Pseudomonadota bacterium]
MKSNDRFTLLLSILFLVFLGVGSSVIDVLAADAPIHIEANRMTSTEKSNSVVFTGDVDAKQGDVRIRSDEMTVFYNQLESPTKEKDKKKVAPQADKKATQQVEKLICIGNVEVTRGEWLGTSKKMIYLSKERQVILTDNAKAWQGQNMVSGEKIIYYLDEGRSEVIGGSKATTAGDTEGGKKKPSRVNMTILQN